MKKLLCLILTLALFAGSAFALASCKEKEKDIYDLASELNATKTVTFVEYKTASGDELNGEYVMEVSGSNSKFTYSYDRYRTADELIADNTNERIKTITGAVYCKDGKYSGDGVVWGSSPVATDLKFNITAENLVNATVSEDGHELVAEITPEKAEATLGVALDAEGNISLTVTSNGTYLTGVTISCTTKSGASMTIRTSYSYNALTIDFPVA